MARFCGAVLTTAPVVTAGQGRADARNQDSQRVSKTRLAWAWQILLAA
jgi:hypothetical protein